MRLKQFSESIKESAEILKSVSFDLYSVLCSSNNSYDTLSDAMLSNVCLQVAFTDVLTFIDLQFDKIMGQSIGEVVAAYASGCLTKYESLLTAYWIAKCADSPRQNGSMFFVECSPEEFAKYCSPAVFFAYKHDSNAIISGEEKDVEKYLKALKPSKIVSKIHSFGKALHSPLMSETIEDILIALKKLIKEPNKLSSQWIRSKIDCEDLSNLLSFK
ncbi:fatty acid synthase-like protein [Dinothrombium tinctorium]|uniref:Fatty acid synthase-like protein n=1 Tax=Dinothrombium tinctorium TaxID=1965070 RepID=A0A443RD31_9ACAR|nr:fatty acid synthase-like protein [Dinothrombium tinctorium]